MNFCVKTVGCKVNIYESNKIIESLEKNGFNYIDIDNFDTNKRIDFYIVNTCSVTQIADKKSRQILHRIRRQYPNCKVIAVGCFVDSLDENDLELKNIADIFIKNNEKDNIVSIIKNYIKSDELDIKRSITNNSIINKQNVRYFIKIQDGCDQFCTYCIIPYLRGRIKSRDEEQIINEIFEKLKNGVKEVILTGIHLSSYGLDKENMTYENNGALEKARNNLLNLIENIAKLNVDGNEIERIRLGSLEPRIINEKLISTLCDGKLKDKFCHNFTLSLQSGSDKILKSMNRHYTVSDFENAVNTIRKYMIDSTITADIIVGFPGETDEDFNETLNFVKKIRFYNPNIFPYSKRPGTKAANFLNQLSKKTKHERVTKLIDICERITDEIEHEHTNNTDILVEEIIENDGIRYGIGYTKEYIKKKIVLNNEGI